MVPPIDTPLSRLRIQRGLTQEEVALAAGVSAGNLARIESGRHTPGFESMVGIARALGMEPSEYFDAVYRFWREESGHDESVLLLGEARVTALEKRVADLEHRLERGELL